jgi:hypothetical protein
MLELHLNLFESSSLLVRRQANRFRTTVRPLNRQYRIEFIAVVRDENQMGSIMGWGMRMRSIN